LEAEGETRMNIWARRVGWGRRQLNAGWRCYQAVAWIIVRGSQEWLGDKWRHLMMMGDGQERPLMAK
jgi:hypothetical protein